MITLIPSPPLGVTLSPVTLRCSPCGTRASFSTPVSYCCSRLPPLRLWMRALTVTASASQAREIMDQSMYKFVFSPAYMYLRHVGPISLQYRIPFDVGIVLIHKLWCGHSLHPSYALLSCLKFCLGRTLYNYACITFTCNACMNMG